MKGNMKKLVKPDWSMMPTEILEQIWKRLTIPHQALVSSVCKMWHSSTTNKASIWASDIPWLITDEGTSLGYRLSSITLGKNFYLAKPFAPSDYYAFIIGSSKGWIVIEYDIEIFSLNLFSKLRIDLPHRSSKPGFLPEIPLFLTMSMCAKLNPITVAGITSNWNLIWCNIGDKEWKGYISNEKYVNVAFLNDKLYVINQDGDQVDIFRVDNDKHELIHRDTICATIPTVRRSYTFGIYLVESNGSILVIKRYYHNVNNIYQTIGFDIFKVQEKIDGDSPHMLMNVESLGDQALFISNRCCESLPVKDCPMIHENHIYFIDDHVNDIESVMGIYWVDRGDILREPIPLSSVDSPTWLLPRYAFECNCKCHPSTIWTTAN